MTATRPATKSSSGSSVPARQLGFGATSALGLIGFVGLRKRNAHLAR